MKKTKERRGSLRKEKSIPVFFSNSKDRAIIETRTINLASNGLYCTVKKHIELYTKVFCTLVHPDTEHDEKVMIEGVVVRCEPEQKVDSVNSYNIAVFFSKVSDIDIKKIESWLS